MHELTDFPGKNRHFNIATELGIKFYYVGSALLNDKSGTVVPAIVLEHRGNAEQINMDILSRWVQGKGIADHTWRGLLGVLRVHCPGLAHDIEETLRAETDLNEEDVPELSVEPESESVATKLNKATMLSYPTKIQAQPSLEECFSSAGIPIDCALLDQTITKTEHIADIARKLTRWKDLFPYFGLEEYEKEEIEAAGDLREQKRTLLTTWTQKLGQRATYRHLCTILCKQHRADLVEAVCEVVKSATVTPTALTPPSRPHPALITVPSSHCHPITPSHSLDRYCVHLKAVYTKTEMPNLKWPPSLGKTFINLAVIIKDKRTREEVDEFTKATIRGDIDQILKKKAPIQLEDIMTVKADEHLKCVLVEGAPGVGKSTLAWHVCQRWGKGELFQEFSTVQLLQLRDTRVQAATCVEDLFPHYDKKLQSEAAQEISNNHGEGTLIILDGLDELPRKFLSQPSIFIGLLSGEVLPHATVMVTSRPSATYKVRNMKISRHIEIIGFTKDNVDEYVKSVLPLLELQQFEDYLSSLLHIKEMMYIPLHCAIVTIVYSQCTNSCRPPPRTLTGLYKCLTQTLLFRYLNDHPDYKEEDYQLDSFSNLPSPVCNKFMTLCKIAFLGVQDEKQVFHDNIDHLGFMAAVPELTLFQQSPIFSLNFLHLSVQEFLAAYYVSLMSPQEQEQLLQTLTHDEYSVTTDHRTNMVRFLAGLTHFKDLNKAVVRRAIGVKEAVEGKTVKLHFASYDLLHESQDVRSILDSKCHYIAEIPPPMRSLHHLHVTLGYIVANSNSTWSLVWNHETHVGLCMVEDLLTMEAKVDYSGLQACTEQLQTSRTYTIENLVFWHGCPPPALTLLMSSVTSLPRLRMNGITFTLELTLTLVCMQISTIMEISNCSVGDFLALLVRNLYNNTILRSLDLNFSSVRKKGAQELAEMLKYNRTLKVLWIPANSIGDEGVISLAESLKYNKTLITLNIQFNRVHDRGAVALGEMLKHNTALTALSIGGNSVGERGGLALAEGLKYNITLKELDMGSSYHVEYEFDRIDNDRQYRALINNYDNYDDTADEYAEDWIAKKDEETGAKALVESLAVNRHLRRLAIACKHKECITTLLTFCLNEERITFK